jgi:hypothetical protein
MTAGTFFGAGGGGNGRLLRLILTTFSVLLFGLALPLAFLLAFNHYEIGNASSEIEVVDSTYSSKSEADLTEDEPEVILSHDVGTILSGRTASHRFRLTNRCNEVLAIQSDADIELNCGCSGVVPNSRQVVPGEEMQVKVIIRTSGKLGSFSHGGKILWTSVSGKKLTTVLSVSGKVIAAFTGEPDYLVFDSDEVKEGVARNLKVTSAVPIQSGTLSVVSRSNQFEISELRIEENGANCKVTCRPRDQSEDLEGSILVHARPRTDDPTSSQEEWPSLLVPVRARQNLDLVIAPKVVLFKFASETNRATARLLLRGKKLAELEHPVKSVHCPPFDSEWKLTRLKEGKSAILEVTLIDSHLARAKSAVLLVEVAGMGVRRLPSVVLFPSSE